MNLLIKSVAGFLLLVSGLGIALAVRNFYLWHQDLVGPYALPLTAGTVWLAHEIGLMILMLIATVGTLAKRRWGGDALAIVLICSTLNVLYRLLWVDTTLLAGPTPSAGYTAGLLVVYIGIVYWLLRKDAAAYYGISLKVPRVGVWVAASLGLFLFDLYA